MAIVTTAVLFSNIKGQVFKPLGMPMKDLPIIELKHDELEAMKLCDMDDLTQEQAGERMGISRGTVQRLLMSARKKVIRSILEKSAIVIVQ